MPDNVASLDTYRLQLDEDNETLNLVEKAPVIDNDAIREGRTTYVPTTVTAQYDDPTLTSSLVAGDAMIDPETLYATTYTPLKDIYDAFFGKITDDLYMEWTKEDTERDLYNIFVDAIPEFEFPRFPLYDFDRETYNCSLTREEINILALCMLNTWLQRQITSIENTRQKYSGTDFKMTSQANHLAKLLELKKETERQCFHMQRLYKRRKIVDLQGRIKSNWSTLMEKSVFDG